MKPGISLCMIAKNEEDFIEQCLSSVQGVVDEIIVVDTGSTDSTIEKAKTFKAKIIPFCWDGNFSNARNAGLKHATHEWILVLDADETISSQDGQQLKTQLNGKNAGYSFSVRTYTNDATTSNWVSSLNDPYEESRAASGWYETKIIRLFKNDKNIIFQNEMHETVTIDKKEGIENLDIPIHHFGSLKGEQSKKQKNALYEGLAEKKAKQSNDFKSYFQLGAQLQESGKTKESIEAFKKSASLNPGFAKTWINLGGLYIKQKDFNKAETTLKKAITLQPQNPEAHNNVGVVLMHLGKEEEALNAFVKAIALNPKYAAAYKNLGLALDKAGRKQEALIAFKKAVILNPAYKKIITFS